MFKFEGTVVNKDDKHNVVWYTRYVEGKGYVHYTSSPGFHSAQKYVNDGVNIHGDIRLD
jgi:hypothetical protein